MGFFQGIEEASATGGGIYFLAGLYTVEIVKAATFKSRKGDDLAIVEGVIITSNNVDRPPGMKAAWLVNMKQDAALGNLKQFAQAVATSIGEDPNGIDEAGMEVIFGAANPLAGLRLGLQCTNIKTRAGKDFTKHEWSAVSGR